MIGRIRGILLEKRPPELLVDVGGVAYELLVSMNSIYRLADIGNEVSLHTHLVVREDAQILYGFVEASERSMFRILIKVNGVGPKLALTILSSIEPKSLQICIENNDTVTLTKLPGIGKKTAERLIMECRDRLSQNEGQMIKQSVLSHKESANQIINPVYEATHALITLGYKPQEASRILSQTDSEGLSAEDLIRLALKQLANG